MKTLLPPPQITQLTGFGAQRVARRGEFAGFGGEAPASRTEAAAADLAATEAHDNSKTLLSVLAVGALAYWLTRK